MRTMQGKQTKWSILERHPSSFTDEMNLYIETPKESTKKTPKPIRANKQVWQCYRIQDQQTKINSISILAMSDLKIRLRKQFHL